jgi:UDP-N-acetylmuramate: L-alanyl-gamma-D-glutamyl-meso-diaminopimelate ligase
LILTHVEFDHADIYTDLAAVKIAFKRLVNLVPRLGLIVAYDGSVEVTECVEKAFCPVERYGFSESADWRLKNLRHEDRVSQWEVWHQGAFWAELEMSLAGEHNALNATAAAALATGRGVDKAAIISALKTFKSVKRRLEVRAVVDGVIVIDDFAHHPTAIQQTLRALRSAYPTLKTGGKLWAILEPRSNTLRRKVLSGALIESLCEADEVVMDAVYQVQKIPEAERLDATEVIAAVNAKGTHARLCANVDSILDAVVPEVKSGDVIAILSNGGFDGIYEKLPLRLVEGKR